MNRQARRLAAAASLAPLLLTACSAMIPQTSTSDSGTNVPTVRRPTTTTSTTSTTSTPASARASTGGTGTAGTGTTGTGATAAAAAAAAAAGHLVGAVPVHGLGPGDRGAQVAALEQALDAVGYDVGVVDDAFDDNTRHAVVAFQKVTGLARTGRATPDVAERFTTAQPPPPLVPGAPPHRVEIDLPRQVLFLYEGGALSRILPVSTGSGKRFCDGGRCRRAVTPAGKFQVYRRISGWRKSDLGRLFNPLYFNGGIAIHGYPSVPVGPASHGCVRIPMGTARWFPERVPDGTPVYVLDGKTSVSA